MATSDTARQEKQFVAQFSEQQAVLPPDQIQRDPRNKELGGSSKALSLRDFELVRTLGTGAFPFQIPSFLFERREGEDASWGCLLMRVLRV